MIDVERILVAVCRRQRAVLDRHIVAGDLHQMAGVRVRLIVRKLFRGRDAVPVEIQRHAVVLDVKHLIDLSVDHQRDRLTVRSVRQSVFKRRIGHAADVSFRRLRGAQLDPVAGRVLHSLILRGIRMSRIGRGFRIRHQRGDCRTLARRIKQRIVQTDDLYRSTCPVTAADAAVDVDRAGRAGDRAVVNADRSHRTGARTPERAYVGKAFNICVFQRAVDEVYAGRRIFRPDLADEAADAVADRAADRIIRHMDVFDRARAAGIAGQRTDVAARAVGAGAVDRQVPDDHIADVSEQTAAVFRGDLDVQIADRVVLSVKGRLTIETGVADRRELHVGKCDVARQTDERRNRIVAVFHQVRQPLELHRRGNAAHTVFHNRIIRDGSVVRHVQRILNEARGRNRQRAAVDNGSLRADNTADRQGDIRGNVERKSRRERQISRLRNFKRSTDGDVLRLQNGNILQRRRQFLIGRDRHLCGRTRLHHRIRTVTLQHADITFRDVFLVHVVFERTAINGKTGAAEVHDLRARPVARKRTAVDLNRTAGIGICHGIIGFGRNGHRGILCGTDHKFSLAVHADCIYICVARAAGASGVDRTACDGHISVCGNRTPHSRTAARRCDCSSVDDRFTVDVRINRIPVIAFHGTVFNHSSTGILNAAAADEFRCKTLILRHRQCCAGEVVHSHALRAASFVQGGHRSVFHGQSAAVVDYIDVAGNGQRMTVQVQHDVLACRDGKRVRQRDVIAELNHSFRTVRGGCNGLDQVALRRHGSVRKH